VGLFAYLPIHFFRKEASMKNKFLVFTIIALLAFSALSALFWFVGNTRAAVNYADREGLTSSPLVSAVQPNSASNDIDTPIVIQGSGFTATLSGTQVISAPLVYLGDRELPGVVWVNTTTLSATVPWGLVPQVYTLTVVNSDGISTIRQNAFTVTDGLGQFTTGGPYGGMASQLKLKPGDPNSLYASMFGAGLFLSEDAAGSWAPIHDNNWPLQLDFDAQDSDSLYLGADSNNMYRSTDNGTTWTPILEDFYTENGCFSAYPVAHPTQSGQVYFGMGSCAGINLEPGEGGVFYSTDFGDTWNARNNGLSDLDVQTLAIHPNNPETLLAGTFDGHLFYTIDGGDNWVLSTLLTGTVSRLYFNPYEPLEAWAITRSDAEDRGYLYRSTNLTNWALINLNVQPQGGPIQGQMAFLPGSIWLASMNVYSSTNSGASWDQLANVHNGNATAMAISPDDPQVIYVGTDFGIEKSIDGGSTWEEAVDGLAALVPNAVAVSPDDPDQVYVKTHQGVFASQNGGHNWQYLDYGSGGFNGRQSLVVDQSNATKIYLNAECQGEFCLAISSDSGTTWNLITSTLPAAYAGWWCSSFVIVPSPHTPGRVLVGASLRLPNGSYDEINGIFFRSDDYGMSWSYIEPPQTLDRIEEMAYDVFDPNLIYAATKGTGLWRSTDDGDIWEYLPVADMEVPIAVSAIAVHPNVPNRVFIRAYSYANGPNPEPELSVSDDAGENWQSLTYVFLGVDLLVAPPLPEQLFYGLYTGCEQGLCRSFDEGVTWVPVEGIPRPEILMAATDGERSVIYLGTPGGLVNSAGAQANLPTADPGRGNVLGGGVYRLTTVIPDHWVYLPLVSR